MKTLPPSLIRPATLNEVQSPAVVLQTANYGASFLVVGDGVDGKVIFLDGEYQFRSFAKSEARNWNGLAIEGVEFEIDIETAFDLSGVGRGPGMAIRRDGVLNIAAIAEGPFQRTIEIPIVTELPTSTTDLAVGFTHWRAVVAVGDEH